MSDTTFVVEPRFCGPPGSGNGGYVAGRLLQEIGAAAEVTLRRPVPLGRRLTIDRRREGGVTLRDGDVELATAVASEVDVGKAPAVSTGEAAAAAARFPRFDDHPLPGCFACGVERAHGDGLRIFPGPVSGRESVWAAPWRPAHDLGDSDGVIAAPFLAAALDCAGAFAVNEPPRGLALLGRIAVALVATVHAGEDLVVVAWPLGREGRKLYPATALLRASGEIVARARATWILT